MEMPKVATNLAHIAGVDILQSCRLLQPPSTYIVGKIRHSIELILSEIDIHLVVDCGHSSRHILIQHGQAGLAAYGTLGQFRCRTGTHVHQMPIAYRTVAI